MKQLIIVNFAIWLILGLASLLAGPLGIDVASLQALLVLPGDPQLLLWRPWTLLSYMFTQFNFLHLLFNILWLYWFWKILASRYSSRQLYFLYIGGGLSGGICWILCGIFGILHPGDFLCGASASVLAMMGLAMLSMGDCRLNLMLFGEVKMKWFALICILLTFVGQSSASPGSLAAHFGGAAFGIVYSLISENKIREFSFLAKEKERIQRLFKREHKPATKQADHRRLDQLLDKVRLSGYNSLTPAEKRELNAISARIKN